MTVTPRINIRKKSSQESIHRKTKKTKYPVPLRMIDVQRWIQELRKKINKTNRKINKRRKEHDFLFYIFILILIWSKTNLSQTDRVDVGKRAVWKWCEIYLEKLVRHCPSSWIEILLNGRLTKFSKCRVQPREWIIWP